MPRVITYIDGFNLCFGLKSKGWERYLWLNVQALSMALLKTNQNLVHTKYFTSRVASPPDKVKRQNIYIEASGTLGQTSIFFGKFQTNPYTCKMCGHVRDAPQEKMTDVNIAVELMTDAFNDGFDDAILISADSDLIASVVAVKRLFPAKRVVVACPPGRFSTELTRAGHAFFTIGHGSIEKSQFPDEVLTSTGFILRRPTSWK